MPRRRGFSLVELLTALVLLSVGLAASVRAAAGVAQLERDARLRRALAAMIIARLDSLSALPCGERSGQNAWHGVHERWRATVDGRRLVVRADLSVPTRPSLGRALAADVACRP